MVILNNMESEFSEVVTSIFTWYDKHMKLWCIQKLNKDGYQIGNVHWVYGKADAMKTKSDLEKEYNL